MESGGNLPPMTLYTHYRKTKLFTSLNYNIQFLLLLHGEYVTIKTILGINVAACRERSQVVYSCCWRSFHYFTVCHIVRAP